MSICTCSYSSNCIKHIPICTVKNCPCSQKDSVPKQSSAMAIKQYYESIIDSYKQLIQKASNQKKKLMAKIQVQQKQNVSEKKLMQYIYSNSQTQLEQTNEQQQCLCEAQDEQMYMVLKNHAIIFEQSKQLQTKLALGKKLLDNYKKQHLDSRIAQTKARKKNR